MVGEIWKIKKVVIHTDKWNKVETFWENNLQQYIFKISQNNG